jgi:putative Mn2+ efflux pump MntP
MLAVLAFIAPLSLDSFAVAAALGAQRPSRAQRWRLSALIVAFEAGMPLIGLAVGAPVAGVVGSAAEYAAGFVLVGVGLWMLRGEADEDEEAQRLLTARGWTAVALGLSISLDELAIGFTMGLAGVPVAVVIVAIAVQALVASQLGLALGVRISEAWRDRAEKLAGLLLIVLGVGIVVAQLVD